MSVRVEELSVALGGRTVLCDVSFDASPGAIVAVVGPNGAGKTTLLDAIAGTVVPTGGRVVLAEGTRIGRVFQGSGSPATLTVGEVFALVTPDVDALLRRFGLLEHENAFIAELSTGMRRIVNLASAMAREPSLLLLDEPASGLARGEVDRSADLLLHARARTGATMVVVEHDAALVRAIADEVVVMEGGVIVARGEPQAILDAQISVSRALHTPGDNRFVAALARISDARA